MVVFFLALVASGILIQTAFELRRGGGVQALEVFRQKPTSANLRAYERNLEDASVVARALRPLFQFAQFAWLRDGGEKALIGRDGWLFYKPGFDYMVARDNGLSTATNDPVPAIVGFRDALAARGIHLLVVPAPNKESVYPDQLTRRVPAGQGVISPATLKTCWLDFNQRVSSAWTCSGCLPKHGRMPPGSAARRCIWRRTVIGHPPV